MTAPSGIDKPFPERCLRGLRDEKSLEPYENGSTIYISWKAFEPINSTQDRISRRGKSDHFESSINWEDHVAESFQKLCNDQNNTKSGIVSICLADLEKAKHFNGFTTTSFEWEREPVKGNPFHGNLLFSGKLSRPMIRELAAIVAASVQDRLVLIKPENYETELAARVTLTVSTNKSKRVDLGKRILAFLRSLFKP